MPAVSGGSPDFPLGPPVRAPTGRRWRGWKSWLPMWCLHCRGGLFFCNVWLESGSYCLSFLCFHCPLISFGCRQQAFWGLFLFASIGVSGLMASLAPSVGYMRQKENSRSHHRVVPRVLVAGQSAAFSSPLSVFHVSFKYKV